MSAGKVTDFVKRKGNLRLHKALLYAASSEMRNPDSRLARWGCSIAGRHRKGGYRKATGALARRLACGLWHVQRLAQPFDAAKYRFGDEPVPQGTPGVGDKVELQVVAGAYMSHGSALSRLSWGEHSTGSDF